MGAIPCGCNSTSTVSTLFLLGQLAFYIPLVLLVASSKQMYIGASIWYGEVNKYVTKTKNVFDVKEFFFGGYSIYVYMVVYM